MTSECYDTINDVLNEYINEHPDDLWCSRVNSNILNTIASYTRACVKGSTIELTSMGYESLTIWEANNNLSVVTLREYIRDLVDLNIVKIDGGFDEKRRIITMAAQCLSRVLARLYARVVSSIRDVDPDKVVIVVDHDKSKGYMNDLRDKRIYRIRVEEGGDIVKEKTVWHGAIKTLIVHRDPLTKTTKYEVEWVSPKLEEPLRIEPVDQDTLYEILKQEFGAKPQFMREALDNIIEALIEQGRAEIRVGVDAPGFYILNGSLTAIRWKPEEVGREDLARALELLDELAEKWFGHAKDKFATVVKWGLTAPFHFVYKQLGRGSRVRWLFLYGPSGTGKSTLGVVVLSMWGLVADVGRILSGDGDSSGDDVGYILGGSAVNNEPRLGRVLGKTTFPILVNEPGNVINKPDIVEMMKNAIESTVARGKYVSKSHYRIIPSLAPLIMTSNKALPHDDALRRRLILVTFSFGERVIDDREKRREFEENVVPRFTHLKALGHWAARRILSDPSLLERDPLELARHLLEEAYREVGRDPPEWINLLYEEEEDVYEIYRESIRSYLVKRINDEYTRFVGRVEVARPDTGSIEYYTKDQIPFPERVRIVIDNKLLPWAIMKGDLVILTTDFAREIRNVVGDLGGLKSIAELLGWEYSKSIKVGRGVVIQGIKVKINEFIEFLDVSYEE